jgi:hypothetical protein
MININSFSGAVRAIEFEAAGRSRFWRQAARITSRPGAGTI